MIRNPRSELILAAVLAAALLPLRASAQEGLPSNSPFRGGVPTGVATADVLPLSAAEVIERALQRNLGVLSADYGVDRAKGAQRYKP